MDRSSHQLLVLLLSVGIVACRESTYTAAEPLGLSANAQAPGSVSPVALCELALRSPSGKYKTKTKHLPLPKTDATSTTMVYYRGWAKKTPDPVNLAKCEVPNSPEAIDAVLTLLANGKSVVRGGIAGEAPDSAGNFISGKKINAAFNPRVSLSMYIDYVYDGIAGECDPLWGCGCDVNPAQDGCEGYGQGGTYAQSEGLSMPPNDSYGEQPLFVGGGYANGGDTFTSSLDVACYGQSDDAHNSHHYESTINVEARTYCPPGYFSPKVTVNVVLQKWQCWWIICWWSPRGLPGYDEKTYNSNYPGAVANSATTCSVGWWRGSATHTAVKANGAIAAGRTSSQHLRYLDCYLD